MNVPAWALASTVVLAGVGINAIVAKVKEFVDDAKEDNEQNMTGHSMHYSSPPDHIFRRSTQPSSVNVPHDPSRRDASARNNFVDSLFQFHRSPPVIEKTGSLDSTDSALESKTYSPRVAARTQYMKSSEKKQNYANKTYSVPNGTPASLTAAAAANRMQSSGKKQKNYVAYKTSSVPNGTPVALTASAVKKRKNV